jgi:hypothetical protein
MPKSPVKPAPERKIFVSYSHADIGEVRQLLKWLRPICRRLPGANEAWVDYEQLKGGDDWNPSILQAVEAANVFIVVMSIDYVDSKFCIPEELKRIMAKRAQGQAQVLGVLLRKTPLNNFSVSLDDGSVASLAQVQCLPQSDHLEDGGHRLGLRAILTWPKETRDEAWDLLARQLEDALVKPGGGLAPAPGATPAVPVPVPLPLPLPTPVPLPLPAPAAPNAPARLVAQWLPYLANRHEQRAALNSSLDDWTQAGCKRPLVVLTEGRIEDCPPKWVDRLQSYELVRSLELEAQGQSFGHPKSFSWPTAARALATVADVKEQFERALADCLGPRPRSPIAEVVSAYKARQRPTLLWVACPDRGQAEQSLRALEALLQVLGLWDDLNSSHMLVVAVNLERAPQAGAGERAELAADFERLLSQAEADGKIHAALLGSLPELDENDITRWAQDHAPDALTDDITALCGALPPTPNALWPMRTFAEKARQWFGSA